MKKSGLVVSFILILLNLQAQNCPSSILVNAPSTDIVTGKTFQFSANITGLPANLSVTYNWSISSGTIVSGQGTSVITVDPGDEPGYCTSSVEIGGLPAQCRNTASSSVDILKAPEKIVSTNILTAAGLSDAVKKFISKTDFMNINISQSASVKICSANAQSFAKLKVAVEKAFESNNIHPYQFTVVDGGVNKTAAVEMFLIKSGN